MKKIGLALCAAAVVTLGVATASAPAEARGGGAFIGGLAAGALLGAAVASAGYYGPGYGYYAPTYYGSSAILVGDLGSIYRSGRPDVRILRRR
jgi:hypothetical protein